MRSLTRIYPREPLFTPANGLNLHFIASPPLPGRSNVSEPKPKSNNKEVAFWTILVVLALVAWPAWLYYNVTPDDARRTREQLYNAYKGRSIQFHRSIPPIPVK